MRGPSMNQQSVMAPAQRPTSFYVATEGLRTSTYATNPTFRAIPVASTAVPYGYQATITPAQATWRESVAVRWAQWHLALALFGVIAAAVLLVAGATTNAPAAPGLVLLVGSLFSIALCAFALRLIDYRASQSGMLVLLLTDIVATVASLYVFGPRLELCAIIPASLLITALLVDQTLVIAGGALAFMAYLTMLVLNAAGVLHAQITLDAAQIIWLDAAMAFIGMGMLLVAITLVTGQHRRALANEAAVTHLLRVHERRAQSKRIAIDADAIALQAEITRAMRGGQANPVLTCEELAPLAQMVNATTSRLPGLLHDREERLRLEKAIRDLAGVLETAWAGFDWSWPAPTGTALDRLVTILRPSRQQTNAS